MILPQPPALQILIRAQAVPAADMPAQSFPIAAIQADHIIFADGLTHRYRRSQRYLGRIGPSNPIKLLVAEGNLVAAWTTYEGTQRGPMGPFPPSGLRAQFDFGAVCRID